uniref:Uncharacterized protein n=1 Tax=Arundo donax TaxID=35708 RepID=A0A0A9H053_ARUDO
MPLNRQKVNFFTWELSGNTCNDIEFNNHRSRNSRRNIQPIMKQHSRSCHVETIHHGDYMCHIC